MAYQQLLLNSVVFLFVFFSLLFLLFLQSFRRVRCTMEEDYEVEEILSVKLNSNDDVVYEVKWKGFGSDDNGWYVEISCRFFCSPSNLISTCTPLFRANVPTRLPLASHPASTFAPSSSMTAFCAAAHHRESKILHHLLPE